MDQTFTLCHWGHWFLGKFYLKFNPYTTLAHNSLTGVQIKKAHFYYGDFPSGLVIENLPAVQEPQETWVQLLGQEDPLEKEGQVSPVFLPGESPWTEESHGLQSTGLQRVKRNWSDLAHTHTLTIKNQFKVSGNIYIYYILVSDADNEEAMCG